MDKTIESSASDSVTHSKRDILQLFIRPLVGVLNLQSTYRRPTFIILSTLADKIEILPSYSMLVILYGPTLMITGRYIQYNIYCNINVK